MADLKHPPRDVRSLVDDGVPPAKIAEILMARAKMLAKTNPRPLEWMAHSWLIEEARRQTRLANAAVEAQERQRLAEKAEAERREALTTEQAAAEDAAEEALRAKRATNAERARYYRMPRWKQKGFSSAEECQAYEADQLRKGEEALVEVNASVAFTQAFLEAEFALADGRRVTWGSATVSDHEARIEMMTKMVVAAESDIALHRQILEVLVASGASCLNEVRRAA